VQLVKELTFRGIFIKDIRTQFADQSSAAIPVLVIFFNNWVEVFFEKLEMRCVFSLSLSLIWRFFKDLASHVEVYHEKRGD
jgi:hypothetical protein